MIELAPLSWLAIDSSEQMSFQTAVAVDVSLPGSGQAGSMGQGQLYEVQQGKLPSPALGP